jgi:hypothetical protein
MPYFRLLTADISSLSLSMLISFFAIDAADYADATG